MDLLTSWLFDPANWSGSTGVPARLVEHLWYTALALVIAIVIGLPLGALVGHTKRGGFVLVGAANVLRALPTLGVLTLVVLLAGIGLVAADRRADPAGHPADAGRRVRRHPRRRAGRGGRGPRRGHAASGRYCCGSRSPTRCR